ncbi:hypothetical protein DFH07DRAFT_936691 [Mycena maculata]|uniref:DUF6699 domain-containing protein n=1 Tax=Mycena maculata TaxID=230809 RepID=A0AAD7K448_9AGAR|nr:hypothetical protein DFH07DRAFT_936691 [Mycena maculata]
MSLKEVRWKLTVDEYASRDSPESWTSPLSATPHSPVPVPPPPPTPNPVTLQVHPALSAAHALQLDLSFPSEAFRSNPQLTQSLLDAPACTPPRSQVEIIVGLADGAVQVRLESKHCGRRGLPVTVGDVLTTIHKYLRQYDNGRRPIQAEPYMWRRIATVNGYCAGHDPQRLAANMAVEHQGQGRIVDHLLGHTQFAGLDLQAKEPDHFWKLNLKRPARYIYSLGVSISIPILYLYLDPLCLAPRNAIAVYSDKAVPRTAFISVSLMTLGTFRSRGHFWIGFKKNWLENELEKHKFSKAEKFSLTGSINLGVAEAVVERSGLGDTFSYANRM